MERKHFTELEEYWHRPWTFVNLEGSKKDAQESSDASNAAGQDQTTQEQQVVEQTLAEGVETTLDIDQVHNEWQSVVIDDHGKARWMLD